MPENIFHVFVKKKEKIKGDCTKIPNIMFKSGEEWVFMVT